MFTGAHNWSLSWARWVKSTPSNLVLLRPVLILSFMYALPVFLLKCLCFLLSNPACHTHLSYLILLHYWYYFGEHCNLFNLCNFLFPLLSSKCSPQHFVIKHPEYTVSFPWCKRLSFTPIQNNMSYYNSVYYIMFRFSGLEAAFLIIFKKRGVEIHWLVKIS